MSKIAALEIEGLNAGLRFKELRALFKAQGQFSKDSAVARRLVETLKYLDRAFPEKSKELRNRSVVQSVATLAARIVESKIDSNSEKDFHRFVAKFMAEFSRQVELGLDATDEDYIEFQKSINANVRGSAKTRHLILMRKLLRLEPSFANVFDAAAVARSGLGIEISRLGESIASLIEEINAIYSAKNGYDLFKPTNKTVGALNRLAKPVKSLPGYKKLISDLYFLFHESVGQRLKGKTPLVFADINSLRTDLEHDLDHGKSKKAGAARRKITRVFSKYASAPTPGTTAPEHFPVFQASLLSAIEIDLRELDVN